MFSKNHRLSRQEFDYYFSHSRPYHADTVIMRHAPSSSYKVSVVVGKKVSKRAVIRNRVRRQVYAAIRRAHGASPLSGAYIFMVKPAFLKVSKAQHYEIVRVLLAKTAENR